MFLFFFLYYGFLKITNMLCWDVFGGHTLFQNKLAKCAHLVYKIIKYVVNRYLFSLMFFYMIHAYENVQKNIWLLVSFHRHKNITSRCEHIRISQHTVMKIPTCTKLNCFNVAFYMYFSVREITFFFLPFSVQNDKKSTSLHP